jgi:hypothetical protein
LPVWFRDSAVPLSSTKALLLAFGVPYLPFMLASGAFLRKKSAVSYFRFSLAAPPLFLLFAAPWLALPRYFEDDPLLGPSAVLVGAAGMILVFGYACALLALLLYWSAARAGFLRAA